MRQSIAMIGAGRMGRGIAVAFAYAGHRVHLVDLKPRAANATIRQDALGEVAETLNTLAGLGMLAAADVAACADRVSFFAAQDLVAALDGAGVIFEGVPETIPAKKACLELVSAKADPKAIIASTTSTILSDELQPFVTGPERFLNAHWLNPAYLVPLVELSPGKATAPEVVERLTALLTAMGKVPVTCAASPGYIVPRIQALAMNEAARMVEDGVASAEDIDKAVKYGFGLRFSVLGLLEFIDWGGGDILYHASRYMQEATGEDRFAPPAIVADNMKNHRRGLKDRQGFLSYDGMDVPRYKQEKLAAFLRLLDHLGKRPIKG